MLTAEDLNQIRSLFEEVLDKRLGSSEAKSEWLPTVSAIKALGYNHKQQLYQKILDGTFREGKEYQDRRSSLSAKHCYWFNVSACLKQLSVAPEKRSFR